MSKAGTKRYAVVIERSETGYGPTFAIFPAVSLPPKPAKKQIV